MRLDLCGHLLRVNCGKGDVDVLVNNLNSDVSGLGLYASAWSRVTRDKTSKVTSCRVVELSHRHAIINSTDPMCFYAPGYIEDSNYHELGLLNTGSRIVSGASLNGFLGEYDSKKSNLYYKFNVFADKSYNVTFQFEDIGNFPCLLASVEVENTKELLELITSDFNFKSFYF